MQAKFKREGRQDNFAIEQEDENGNMNTVVLQNEKQIQIDQHTVYRQCLKVPLEKKIIEDSPI